MSRALIRAEALGVTLRGHARCEATTAEAPRSPASDTPCVHWRLRITETVGPGLTFVHEVQSEAPFELQSPDRERPLRVGPDARIEALPTLYREGTAGALAVQRHFGLVGTARVEEVLVRLDEEIEVTGMVIDEPATSSSPFRTVGGALDLLDATVRVPGRWRRPSLLPWALGTAAALAGTASLATAVARHLAGKPVLRAFSVTSEVGSAPHPRPRWP